LPYPLLSLHFLAILNLVLELAEARPPQNAALNRMLRRRNVANEDAVAPHEAPANAAPNRPREEDEDHGDDSGEDEAEDTGAGLGPNLQGVGVKKLRKLAEKEDRARNREAMEAAKKKRKALVSRSA
jgi:hypothetical protein